MKRLLGFMLALSACGLYTYYVGAVPSLDDTADVMVRLSLSFGLLSMAVMLIFVLRRQLWWGVAALTASVFWFACLPFAQELSAPFLCLMLVSLAVLIADLVAGTYKDVRRPFIRTWAATSLGLCGAVLGQYMAYKSETGETFSIVVVIELIFFGAAFVVAPWRHKDLQFIVSFDQARRRFKNL